MAPEPQKLTWAQLVAQPSPLPEDRKSPVAVEALQQKNKGAASSRATKAQQATRHPRSGRPQRPRSSRNTVACAKVSSSNINSQPKNLLLRLPGELRNQIYSLILLEQKPIIAIQVASELLKTRESQQPALSLTCRQLREEVLGYWFAGNAFVVAPPPDQWVKRRSLGNWARTLGPYVKHVSRVGCLWQTFEISGGKFVSRSVTLMATLFHDPPVLPPNESPFDPSTLPPRLHAPYLISPPVIPPHNSPFISASGGGRRYGWATCSKTGETVKLEIDIDAEDLCSHTLQKSCEEFVHRCKGRGLRRALALEDVMNVMCNKLMPIESMPYHEKCLVCAGWRTEM